MSCWKVFVKLLKDFPKNFKEPESVPDDIIDKYNSFFVKNGLHSRFYLYWVQPKASPNLICELAIQTGVEDHKRFSGEEGLWLIAAFCDASALHRKDIELDFGSHKESHIDVLGLNSLFNLNGIDCHIIHRGNGDDYFFFFGNKKISVPSV